MAKNDQEEAYEKILSSTLTRTIDFLKFGETKNAALLTFSSAWILALTGTLAKFEAADSVNSISASIVLFSLSAASAIFSFLPKTNLDRLYRDPSRDKSLLYFGDIASFEPASYKERVSKRYTPPDGETATQAYLDDLAIQISVNSKLALRKFKFFNFGACLALAAAICTVARPWMSSIKFVYTHLFPLGPS